MIKLLLTNCMSLTMDKALRPRVFAADPEVGAQEDSGCIGISFSRHT